MADKECCVLTLPLQTEIWQEHIIEKRFAIMEHLKNQLIAKELRRLKNLERTKEYRNLIDEINNTPKEKRKALFSKRRKLLKDSGFSEYDFKDDIAGKNSLMQKHFIEHIATQIAHKLASDVWRSFDKFLFGNGRFIHFSKRGSLRSVASQKNGNGMTYKNGYFIWSGGQSKNKIILKIKVTPPKNEYEKEMLSKKIKYLRIVKKWVKTRYKYYLQFALEGKPVKKDRIVNKGNVGIDIGTQTVAISSADSVKILELADKIDKNHTKKKILQRKMDRSRRYTNPQNYNEDGTIKKPPKGQRFSWYKSKKYIQLAGKVRELERKNADIRKYQHTCLANWILSLGDTVYVEQMNFSGLQRRAKETKIDKNGKYAKKKRYGKSLANKAPSMFLTILESKLNQYGGQLNKINTYEFKASQYDHTDDTFTKHNRSERWHILSNGDKNQRDLYSAFLIMNSDISLKHCNREKCNETYSNFKVLHDKEIERLYSDIRKGNCKNISSFGFQRNAKAM
ncbi:MAG: transposase [Ruminococcus sp.]|uniref:transposase n=1 Tax=Ruminococcus sp. TaxID=41978 RepID=UPI0026389456|nr:transposase [Ruminococcus sp.]MDD6710121.1 transposase [Ruminococcus sp.]MEE3439743.1 transposase [Ruminococcus sp.]